MELRYTLGVADVIALSLLRSRVLPQTRRRLRLVRLAYLLSLAALGLGNWLLAGDRGVTVAFLALAALVPLLYPMAYRFRVERAAREAYRSAVALEGPHGEHQLAHTLRITEDGLVQIAFAGEARTRWPFVDGQITAPTHAFINLGSAPSIVIPRSQVAPADLQAFLAACQNHYKHTTEGQNGLAGNQ